MDTYEDYKVALMSIGEAIYSGFAHNWDKKLFDRKFDKKLVNDENLKSTEILSIMIAANNYLESNLFIGLISHKNFDEENIGYWLNSGFLNGQLIRIQFYLRVIKYHPEITDSIFIQRALGEHTNDISVAMLQSEHISNMMSLSDKVELLVANREYSKFTERVFGFDHLLAAYVKVYELYDIEVYLTDEVKDIFLF